MTLIAFKFAAIYFHPVSWASWTTVQELCYLQESCRSSEQNVFICVCCSSLFFWVDPDTKMDSTGKETPFHLEIWPKMPLRIWGSLCSVFKNCKQGRDNLHLLLGTLFFFGIETNYMCFLHWIISMIPWSSDESELWIIHRKVNVFIYCLLWSIRVDSSSEERTTLPFRFFSLHPVKHPKLKNLSPTISLWLLTSWHCLLCRDDFSPGLTSFDLISSDIRSNRDYVLRGLFYLLSFWFKAECFT